MKKLFVFLGLLLISLAPVEAAAFLKLGDIKGESTDKDHAGEIDVLSWSWGMSNSGTTSTSGGAGAGKVSMQDISITKYSDLASTAIMLHVANGRHIPTVVLTLTRSTPDGSHEYYKITLTDVIVTSFSTGGSQGDNRLFESLTLNFKTVAVDYTPQKPDGSAGTTVSFGWDLSTNTSL